MQWLKELYADELGKTLITVGITLLVTAFGAFLGGFKDIFIDWWKRRRTSKYNAMLLATTMETFITDCLDVVSDDGYLMPDGQMHANSKRPSEITYPKELDWPSITPDIMFKCLLLPAEIKSAEASIDFVVQEIVSGPDGDEYFEEAQKRYASLGLRAVQILERLRDDFNIEKLDRGDYDPLTVFTKKLADTEKLEKQRQAAQAKMWEELEAKRKATEAAE
ncbi:hypothetical protein I7F96_32220 [Sinorhizobium meliloti]|uniref:hypothetical protein n=1 Tax=Rhizobium meliloti TaxID=382 RepID=UPI0023800DFE|nr:hypothetical protein [Sinorhizobium meliloti]MDE3775430.1 hypothetical protein [Sinorhizobium meliloti]